MLKTTNPEKNSRTMTTVVQAEIQNRCRAARLNVYLLHQVRRAAVVVVFLSWTLCVHRVRGLCDHFQLPRYVGSRNPSSEEVRRVKDVGRDSLIACSTGRQAQAGRHRQAQAGRQVLPLLPSTTRADKTTYKSSSLPPLGPHSHSVRISLDYFELLLFQSRLQGPPHCTDNGKVSTTTSLLSLQSPF